MFPPVLQHWKNLTNLHPTPAHWMNSPRLFWGLEKPGQRVRQVSDEVGGLAGKEFPLLGLVQLRWGPILKVKCPDFRKVKVDEILFHSSSLSPGPVVCSQIVWLLGLPIPRNEMVGERRSFPLRTASGQRAYASFGMESTWGIRWTSWGAICRSSRLMRTDRSRRK